MYLPLKPIALVLFCCALAACKNSSSLAANNASREDSGLQTYRLVSAEVSSEDLPIPIGGEIFYSYDSQGELVAAQVSMGDKLVEEHSYTNISADNWIVKVTSPGVSRGIYTAVDRQDYDNYIIIIWNGAPDWASAPAGTETVKWFTYGEPSNAGGELPESIVGQMRNERELNQFGQTIATKMFTKKLDGSDFLYQAASVEYTNGATIKRLTLTKNDLFSPRSTQVQYDYTHEANNFGLTLNIQVSGEGEKLSARYEKTSCGEMLAERSKKMLPPIAPFCIWLPKNN